MQSVPRTHMQKDLSVHIKSEEQATEYIIPPLPEQNNRKNAHQQPELFEDLRY